jgi:hypothetical protein
MISLHRLTYRFAVPAAPLGDAGSPRTAASAKRVISWRFMGLWRGPARRAGGATRAACIHNDGGLFACACLLGAASPTSSLKSLSSRRQAEPCLRACPPAIMQQLITRDRQKKLHRRLAPALGVVASVARGARPGGQAVHRRSSSSAWLLVRAATLPSACRCYHVRVVVGLREVTTNPSRHARYLMMD